jgi:hypothetical protein
MRQRCSNSNHPDYKDYGGRGITVCNEWRDSFETFYEWATTHGYSEDLSIDRIDVNGNYEPDNCRFITMFDQASNKRNNVYIDYESDNVTISEASRRCGLDSGTVGDRIRKGWDEYDATHTEPYKGFGTMVRNRFTNEFWLFDSLAQASEFIGRNRGFLSYLSKKLNRTEFETGDYYVEITKQNIGIP